jgi:hypothetical protein
MNAQNKLFDLLVAQGFDPWVNRDFILNFAYDLMAKIEEMKDEDWGSLHPDERSIDYLPVSLEGYTGKIIERHGRGYVSPDGVSFDPYTQKFSVCVDKD